MYKILFKKLAYLNKFKDSTLSQARRKYFVPPQVHGKSDKSSVIVLPNTAGFSSVKPSRALILALYTQLVTLNRLFQTPPTRHLLGSRAARSH